MKGLIKLICIALISIPFIAKASIVITVQSPRPTGLYSDNLSISLQISSTYSLDTVKATISNRTVLLTPNSNPGSYTGTISLTGLPQGQLQLILYVKDVLKNVQTSNSLFTFDSLPLINVSSPVSYTSYQSKLHVKASVTDPGNANCSGRVICGSFNVSFINNIDTLVDIFPTASTASDNLIITATDNSSQRTQLSIPVLCDKSAYLSPKFVGVGQVVDFKDTRVLMLTTDVNNIPHLKLYNTVDTTSIPIVLGSVFTASTKITAMLGNQTVIVHAYTPVPTVQDSIYVWKNNVVVNVCKQVQSSCSVPVNDGVVTSGNYLIWPGANQLFLTDLTTLTTAVAATSVLNAYNDLSNDNISYSSLGGYNVYKKTISTNITRQITNDASSSISNVYPSVDNNNIVYIKQINSAYSVYLNDGLKDYNLGKISDNSVGYLLSGGYVAYGILDNNNVQQVWLRDPYKTLKQLSFFSSSSYVDRLGSNGKTLFTNGGNRYYTDSLTSFVNVSGSLGKTFFVNNGFYLALGGSLYSYILPTPIPTPTITSLNKYSGKTKDTITITGTGLIGATTVNFGGLPASSFTVNSSTSITAVIGTGATGSVSVTTAGGNATLAGFTYLSVPIVSSISPSTATIGNTITITGNYFTGATAVSFGGTSATSFTVNSATSITAVVGTGSSGNVSITNSIGTSTFSGFTFLPIPIVTASGSTTFITGGSVTLTASSGTGYAYQWIKDGINIPGANNATYTATLGGSYTVSVTLNSATQVSSPIIVNAVFALSATNFGLTITSATCKGSANGSVSITAVQNLSYIATITGGTLNTPYPFTSSTQINGLSAGTYNICITVPGQTNYQQCFTVVITEPKDLAVYAITNSNNQVTLNLSGGAEYNINLNGKMYATTDSVVTLPLTRANNQILISTDRGCQGLIEKDITITEDKLIYPNPFENTLSLSVGKNNIQSAIISVYDIYNKLVYTNKYANISGVVQLDLSGIKSGIYVLKLSADNSDTIFKLIKR